MRRFFILSTVYCLLITPVFAQTVDLIWQGDGYAPPFYEGRTLWSQQSNIKLLAIPQGASVANSNYKWSKDGTVLGSLSGVGKNTLTLKDTILSRSQRVTVELVSSDGSTITSKTVTLTPAPTNIEVYENNPLYGFMFHQANNGLFNLGNAEVTFTAFPLFFSTTDRTDNALNYKWQTNSGVSSNGPSATYRVPDGSSGSSLVSVNVSNQNKILQTNTENFSIRFGTQ